MNASVGSTTFGLPAARWSAYPAYRHSGVEWLGEVPEGWEVRRLKTVANARPSNVDKKTDEGQRAVRLCNYVDVYKNEFITADIEFMQATATEAQVREFRLLPGDVLATKDSETADDIAVPALVLTDEADLVCGYHLTLIRAYERSVIGPYLFRAMQAVGVADQFRLRANGVTRFGLPVAAFTEAVFPIPPLPEQRAIAAFLDRETAKLDTLVAKKERLLGLLDEKRTALISRAVTKGLDPDSPMKDPGVEWLGEVPVGWEVVALRRRWQVVDCLHTTPPYVDEGYPLVSTTEVKPGRLDLSGVTRFVEQRDWELMTSRDRGVMRGDIVYSRNASLGAAAFVETDQAFCMGQDVVRITSRDQDQLFLTYALNSPVVLGQVDALGMGSTFNRINVSDIKTLVVALPPLPDQHAIAAHLDRETARIDALKAKIQRAIELLKEYRTALISAAVTGKIDVRAEVAEPAP